MAIKHKLEKDQVYRNSNRQYEFKRTLFKSIAVNRSLQSDTRLVAQFLLDELPKTSSKTQLKNRCLVTGRSKGVSRKYKFSRIELRRLIGKGFINKLNKKSW